MQRPSLAVQLSEEASGESTGTGRWMVSYADFLTLLFVLFVALYMMLGQDLKKAQAKPELHQAESLSVAVLPAGALREQARNQMLELMKLELARLVESGDIRLAERNRRIVLEISEKALFASGDAEPSARAAEVLSDIARVVSMHRGSVKVEGHTDDVPIKSARYPSNWELSAARAAAVVRVLSRQGIEASRLSATGLADTQPVDSSDTPEGRALNRRVNLVLYER